MQQTMVIYDIMTFEPPIGCQELFHTSLLLVVEILYIFLLICDIFVFKMCQFFSFHVFVRSVIISAV